MKKIELTLEVLFVVAYVIETIIYANLPESERIWIIIRAIASIVLLIAFALWLHNHEGDVWQVGALLSLTEAVYIMPFAAFLLSAWLPANIIFTLAGIIGFPGVLGGLAICWCAYKPQSVIDITMSIALPMFGVFTSIGLMLFIVGCFS